MSAIRDEALASRAQLEARFPHVFHPSARARATSLAILALLVGSTIYALLRFDFSVAKLLAGLDKLGTMILLMMPPHPGNQLENYLVAMGETLAIAFLGTFVAALLALPVSLLAARNIAANRIIQFTSRRFFDTIRGIDTLIWALIWINVVGLGPFAGILAILTSDFGTFGKLFSEAFETADKKPVDGVVSAGGNGLHAFRFGVFPQVVPVLVSQVLYYFESNTRSATIIGVVGAGGIGLLLANEIAQAEWPRVAFIILMILAAVAAIDYISAKLRFAIIGRRTVV